ncbi:MAG: hypothetical protein KAQ78_03710, partial [Candidatus Latescibacteria bacterium]|nr:hypothetical protein [Candidatus Latescibacterota bacterium]
MSSMTSKQSRTSKFRSLTSNAEPKGGEFYDEYGAGGGRVTFTFHLEDIRDETFSFRSSDAVGVVDGCGMRR